MRITGAPLLISLIAIAAAHGCAPAPEPVDGAETLPGGPAAAPVVRLDPPVAAGSAEPDLFAGEDGGVYMSWLEPIGADGVVAASTRRGLFALRFARFDGETWSAPRTIADGEDFFVNWADFPSIIVSGDTLVAHWLKLNGGRGTSYDVHISRSIDGGDTWSESIVPHSDGTPTEHGFVSLVAEPDGGFTAIWLDGRGLADGEFVGAAATTPELPFMTLRAGRFDGSGSQRSEVLLDDRVCDCCQTSAAYVGDTLLAVYRDRSPEEVRDIWSVRRTPDGWQQPMRLAHDNWQIPGCPVNGPALAASGTRAAAAWFSMVDGVPEVKVVFSTDAGASFSRPVLVDGSGVADIDASDPRAVAGLASTSSDTAPIPLGRVDVAWVDEDHVAVSWVVARGGEADLELQTVDVNGELGPRRTIGTTGSGRASGFPRMVRTGDRVLIAWTETDDESSIVRAAVINLPPR